MKQLTQEAVLKRMSGEERLEQAFSLSELVRELALKNIKHKYGRDVGKGKLLKELKKRLRYD